MKIRTIFFVSILLCLFQLETIKASDINVYDIQINLRNAPVNPAPILIRAQEHMQLKKGEPFSQKKLDETLHALKQTKTFRDITVERVYHPDGIILIFQMTACNVVKDILINGAFPLFERDVLNVMTVSAGHIWIQEQAEKQESRIRHLFKREGFVQTDVRVFAEKDPKDGYYIVHVAIKAGECDRLNYLDLYGNTFTSTLRLKGKMTSYKVSFLPGNAGCFKEKTMQSDIQSLFLWYRQNGFADVDIRADIIRNKHSVDVKLNIDEGAQYKVHFKGNNFFSYRSLQKDLTFFSKGNRNDSALRRSLRIITKRYRQAGFLNAKVWVSDWMKINKKQKVQHLWFIIDEGQRSILEKIHITGNQNLSVKRIKKQMQTPFPGKFFSVPYQPSTVKEDIPVIKKLYNQQGFLEVDLRQTTDWNSDKTKVSIHIDINEGPRTIIRSISFSGDLFEIDQYKQFGWKTKINSPFNQDFIELDRQMIEAKISDQGFPYVQVREKIHLSKDLKHADITFYINKGQKVRIGQLFFHGNFKTRRSVLKEALAAKSGEDFSLSKTLKAQRNLRDMKIFNSVKLTPLGLKDKKEIIHLFVEVEEKKPLFLEMGGGFKTEKGAFGHIKLGDKNLFGKNKNAWMRFEHSEVGYHGEFNIHDPNLLGEKIDTGFGYYIERLKEFNKVYGTQIYGWSLNLNRKWSQTIRMDMNFRYERRRQFLRDILPDDDENELTADELKPRSILVASPAIIYDIRDSFICPKKGIYASYTMDISNGIANSLDDFIKYHLELRAYYTLNNRLTMACTGRYQTIHEYGSLGKIPDDQLFYLGGSADIRGFKENMYLFNENKTPVGGRTALSGSIEARYSLGFNLEGFAFFDIGNLSDISENIDMNSLRSSTGFGIRYHTPIGPLGLMYGIKNKALENEDRGRLHFAVGYTF
ncbi:outer membrane protein assembly complex, YaeT protein [Candidatus Magnetomorum sp. HK-1]|nr:outer membrane protein assembly complex, YaeT protein [Candidatus Magnetomorum sp. HK-1]